MVYNFKEIEEEVGKNWKKKDIVKKTFATDKKKKLFSFLEGPPTANAPPALHHVEVRVFKDLFCRFKYMQGYNVPRKGGWDCHGLPVEVQIEKKLKLNSKKDILGFGIGPFIKECRESVFSYINDWNNMTEKMAYWIDLEKPYVTLENNYIESVWWSLKELYKKKLLYEDHKVVAYCPRCETPLSSHEVALGYKEVEDPAITVMFKSEKDDKRYFLAFTTTPWTTLSNVALVVNPKLDYVVVKENGKEFVLVKELAGKYFTKPEIIKKIKGKDLVGEKYKPLFPYFADLKNSFRIIPGDFVSIEEGTGIVHAAAAFGEDDYDACKKNNIDFVQPVNHEGKFTEEVKEFAGKFVKKADPEIIEHLENKGLLFKKERYLHNYPFCWRCNTVLIYYAMKSWFIEVTKFKKELLENNQKINWYPGHIKDGRFGNWLENVKDWALSRSKFWGTPLPVWRCECGNEEMIGSVEELREKAVTKLDKEIDLHKPFIDTIKLKCSKCRQQMSRINDVIDCWYDSGAAPFAQFHYPFENKDLFKKSFPYDFIAEAIDQTRGWFYTLHVLGTILFKDTAYKSVVCAGHVVDEKGEKMSKSKGNVLNPWDIFNEVGVDAVRLQFCTSAPGDQKRFSMNLVKDNSLQLLNILWNCYVFTKNFKTEKLKDSSKLKFKDEDKWILSRLNNTIKETTINLEKHNYNSCYNLFKEFVENDFSRFYIKLIRERALDADEELIFVLNTVMNGIIKLMAPFAPYLTDKIYSELNGKKESVHLEDWPVDSGKFIDSKLEEKFNQFKDLLQVLLSEREKTGLGIRWPLQKALIKGKNISNLKDLSELIKTQVNVKEVSFFNLDTEGFKVEFDKTMTKELEEEGYYREIMRRIQDLRKKSNLKREDKINLNISFDVNLKNFENEIKERAGVKILSFNSKKYKESINGKIKEKDFELSFEKAF